MSLKEYGGGGGVGVGLVRPMTAVAWTSNSSTCPKDFTLISITEDGATASFNRSVMKSGYYLCYSKELSGGMVVSDVQIITDKETIPHGYCYIAEYLEHRASVLKKKRVCVRVSPLGSVTTAVLDIKLTAKSKMMLQHYTCVGEIHGYVLWCKKGQFSSPVPQAKPRSVTLDVRRLSLDQLGPHGGPHAGPQPLRPSNPPPQPPAKLSQRRSTLQRKNITGETESDGSVTMITAIDGVPFTLHPKFESQMNGLNPQLNTQLTNIHIKSVQDIENEYSYPFSVEESAAKRTRPSVPAATAS